jgi:hypothetical protein
MKKAPAYVPTKDKKEESMPTKEILSLLNNDEEEYQEPDYDYYDDGAS